jgi:hypothetical protein
MAPSMEKKPKTTLIENFELYYRDRGLILSWLDDYFDDNHADGFKNKLITNCTTGKLY